jgi:hypothetical protein
MNIIDTIYYSIYRFGRSIGQPKLQAKAIANMLPPTSFVLVVYSVSYTLAYKFRPTMLRHVLNRSYFEGILVVLYVVSFIVYVRKGRGQRIISKYEKFSDQRYYTYVGAAFSILTLVLPILTYFLWRLILK